jgi:hypothetical protein
MSVIDEKAMLATVHISVWAARKYDRRISKEVASNHGADERVGRYNKRLLSHAVKLDNIQTIAGRIRQTFYKYSLPWSDEGFRILPTEVYFEFMEQLKQDQQEFWSAVNSFLDSYPGYIEEARNLYGTLFREEDYPSSLEVKKKFDLKSKVIPIPSGQDFRVDISEEHSNNIRKEIDANVREDIARSTRDLWLRAYEVVKHMASRLGDPDAVFRSSTISNVAEMAELLPRLNITKDQRLDELAAEMRQQLCAHSADTLRDNKALRSNTAARAQGIISKIDSALGIEGEATVAPPAPAEMNAEIPAPEAEVDALMQRMFPYMACEAA